MSVLFHRFLSIPEFPQDYSTSISSVKEYNFQYFSSLTKHMANLSCRSVRQRIQDGDGFMRAVIFDMDGVIFDSERIVYELWLELSEKYGFPDLRTPYWNVIGVNARQARETSHGSTTSDTTAAGFPSRKAYVPCCTRSGKPKSIPHLPLPPERIWLSASWRTQDYLTISPSWWAEIRW